ncbi:MAG: GTP-binding protein [Clostridiales bacterium]|nr:GTP-binding protein [Clostridiales bacterium]
MTKIDIFSGFLGAGKTTLIKKLIKEAYAGEKIVLIENEFGEIGIDGGFLQDAGINITEMNSGCICCSLVGDFATALKKVSDEYAPERIVIEPSGVGKLSDVIKAVANAQLKDSKLNAFCTVVDASKCKMYMKNFGEFFGDQVENAGCIILSHTEKAGEEKVAQAVELLRSKNPTANLVTSSWTELDGKTILNAMEQKDGLHAELERLKEEVREHHHEHHHEHRHHHNHDECDDPDCDCHHTHEHHDHDECCCGHEHHEHHHEHGHDHEECHDPNCCCHHEHHHGHHHADEVFTSWGFETTRLFTKEELEKALKEIGKADEYGMILRAKGIVAGKEKWLHFDYVPDEVDVREGTAGVIGRLCVIGCNLNEEKLNDLFSK